MKASITIKKGLDMYGLFPTYQLNKIEGITVVESPLKRMPNATSPSTRYQKDITISIDTEEDINTVWFEIGRLVGQIEAKTLNSI